MNFRKLAENDLSDFAGNVYTQLRGSEITAVEQTVKDALVAAIDVLPATLATRAAAAAVAEDERKAAVSLRNDTKQELYRLMSRVRNALKAGVAPRNQFDLCGFDYPLTKTTYIAQDPTNLSAVGFSNGLNRGRFRGNNKSALVVYEIWRKSGDDGPWLLHATTRRQSFADTPVVPGQFYEYRVRAVGSRSVSNFSNSAVVYGML